MWFPTIFKTNVTLQSGDNLLHGECVAGWPIWVLVTVASHQAGVETAQPGSVSPGLLCLSHCQTSWSLCHWSNWNTPLLQVTSDSSLTLLWKILSSLLPDKKKSFPLDDEDSKCGDCTVRTLEDIPDDIMDATKSLILKKTGESNKVDVLSMQQDIQSSLQLQQQQIDRLESQIQLLLQIVQRK